jgi:hypothetical protein
VVYFTRNQWALWTKLQPLGDGTVTGPVLSHKTIISSFQQQHCRWVVKHHRRAPLGANMQ